MALSIGVFFSTLIAGLATTMPATLFSGLTRHNVPANVATNVANLPPVGTLLPRSSATTRCRRSWPAGPNPTPPTNAATEVDKQFFPQLVADSFHHGLVIVFLTAIAVLLIGAIASLFRGPRYIHNEGFAGSGAGCCVGGH
ncbi:MAG: hypothetical protein LC749_03055 [Actinobacteria bacterium]|nr:hypothetical protein [Actinomycetota bacterium]